MYDCKEDTYFLDTPLQYMNIGSLTIKRMRKITPPVNQRVSGGVDWLLYYLLLTRILQY